MIRTVAKGAKYSGSRDRNLPSAPRLRFACTSLGTQAMDPTLVSLVSACTALVASVVGPVVTLAVARRQFNANVLSVNRQKWIETLRASVAELISLLVGALVIKAGWRGEWGKGLHALTANPSMHDKLERIVLVQWNIRLLINPTDPEHQRLYQSDRSGLCASAGRRVGRGSHAQRHRRYRHSDAINPEARMAAR
jgi:hypothetical protein